MDQYYLIHRCKKPAARRVSRTAATYHDILSLKIEILKTKIWKIENWLKSRRNKYIENSSPANFFFTILLSPGKNKNIINKKHC